MAHWIVQANPAHWRIRDFFTDGHTHTAWAIRRYRDAAAGGDDVALWLSGRDGGVVALGRVAGEPYHGTAPDDAYWSAGPERADARWLMPVEFTNVFLDDPIARAVLRADRRFAGSLILRMAGGGNPFPVTGAEWPAVAERVPHPSEHAVVAATVRGAAAIVAGGATAVREAVRSVVG
jgi:predicted RNA-binding protein with PUA-like domain